MYFAPCFFKSCSFAACLRDPVASQTSDVKITYFAGHQLGVILWERYVRAGQRDLLRIRILHPQNRNLYR